ncbi:MAG: sulfite exporter TauE/SafE family protein [Bacteroidales bacterium]|nr:sulfite exporter TauE/SafE family protein [Bacteroidales bacterium]
MTITAIIIIILAATFASFTQRVSGFGFGIFIMTILPHLMPSYGEATALSGLLAIVTSIVPAIQMARKLPVRKLWLILLTFIITSFFAVLLVTKIDSRSLKHVLGGVLIAVSIYFLFFSGKIHMKPNAPIQLSMGTLSGFMGGLFAMQGPPAVIYFVGCSSDKDEYIALTQWYFLIGNIMMSIFRGGSGLVTPLVGKIWCLAVLGVLLGLWIGAKVYARIRPELLRKIIYAYMAVAGLITLLA